jgi:periplasmic copper chaperone A
MDRLVHLAGAFLRTLKGTLMHTFSRAHARALTTGTMSLAMGALAVAMAASASAHVNVSSTDVRQGGSGKVIVRVPNERPAGTIKVAVDMPTDVLLTSVRAKPHFGWTFTAPLVKLPTPVKQGDKTITEAVRTITWTAAKGVQIEPESFDEFEFTAGKMPTDKKTVSFPSVQTYSNGEVVKWNEPKVAGAAEPKHPAPVLVLLPAAGSEKTAAVAVAPAMAHNDSVARGLGAGAAVVALGGVGLGLQRRRSAVK